MKHGANRRSVSSKTFVVMLALVLALGCAVGGTIAWLTKTTDPVVNTFTYGNIDIELYEHTYNAATNELTTETTKTGVDNYKIVPGKNLPKDPTVKVVGGSEACYLFVKVEKTGDFANGVSYSVDTTEGNWKELTSAASGNTKVYYREVGAVTADTTFNVLAGNQVTVSNTLTKDDIKNLTGPTLTFTAYAVQKENVADAATAWNLVKPATPVVPGA